MFIHHFIAALVTLSFIATSRSALLPRVSPTCTFVCPPNDVSIMLNIRHCASSFLHSGMLNRLSVAELRLTREIRSFIALTKVISSPAFMILSVIQYALNSSPHGD